MNKSLAVALGVVMLDALGLGLIMPILPTLLRELVQSGPVALHYGLLTTLYALMQVLFAPLLGRLSDRHGRRPVLLVSLAGAAVDYAIMAAAPTFWVLYIGRLISGITGATQTVAASTIADRTEEDKRAQWFGFMGACYGGGMIAGPVIGGLLGGISVHAPFIAAALLNGLGFLAAFGFLSESRCKRDDEETPKSTGMFAPSPPGAALKDTTALVVIFFIIQLIGQAPAALWVIYGEDRFHWGIATVGLSLAAFGMLHALVQAFTTDALATRLGERRTLLLGIVLDGSGFILLALATQGWMVAPILILLASGGVAMPALQAILSKTASEGEQGALQGTLARMTNLASIVGPISFTALYQATAGWWNGWVWMVGAALYVPCLKMIFSQRSRKASGCAEPRKAPNQQ